MASPNQSTNIRLQALLRALGAETVEVDGKRGGITNGALAEALGIDIEDASNLNAEEAIAPLETALREKIANDTSHFWALKDKIDVGQDKGTTSDNYAMQATLNAFKAIDPEDQSPVKLDGYIYEDIDDEKGASTNIYGETLRTMKTFEDRVNQLEAEEEAELEKSAEAPAASEPAADATAAALQEHLANRAAAQEPGAETEVPAASEPAADAQLESAEPAFGDPVSRPGVPNTDNEPVAATEAPAASEPAADATAAALQEHLANRAQPPAAQEPAAETEAPAASEPAADATAAALQEHLANRVQPPADQEPAAETEAPAASEPAADATAAALQEHLANRAQPPAAQEPAVEDNDGIKAKQDPTGDFDGAAKGEAAEKPKDGASLKPDTNVASTGQNFNNTTFGA